MKRVMGMLVMVAALAGAQTAEAASWVIQQAPTPEGSLIAELQDVSGTPALSCTAVGLWNPVNSSASLPLAESWTGGRWKIESTPLPAGGTDGQLTGVSCAGTSCEAVGFYSSNRQFFGLTERWDGSSWTMQTIPLPAGASNGILQAVSCTSSSSCVAVGASTLGPLVEI
jgi:hypothetical protein